METLDNELGAVSRKSLKRRLIIRPHNPLVPGSSRGGGILNSLNLLCEQLSREKPRCGAPLGIVGPSRHDQDQRIPRSRGRHPGSAGQTPTCLANQGSGHCRQWEPSVTPPSLRRDDTTFPRLRRLISIDTADGDPSSGSFLLARRAGGEKES